MSPDRVGGFRVHSEWGKMKRVCGFVLLFTESLMGGSTLKEKWTLSSSYYMIMTRIAGSKQAFSLPNGGFGNLKED